MIRLLTLMPTPKINGGLNVFYSEGKSFSMYIIASLDETIGDLKQCIRSGLPARTEKALTKKTRSFMRKLQNRPKHVSNYFKHPKIAYAA